MQLGKIYALYWTTTLQIQIKMLNSNYGSILHRY